MRKKNDPLEGLWVSKMATKSKKREEMKRLHTAILQNFLEISPWPTFFPRLSCTFDYINNGPNKVILCPRNGVRVLCRRDGDRLWLLVLEKKGYYAFSSAHIF